MKSKLKNIMYILVIVSFFKPDYFSGVASNINMVYSLLQLFAIVIGMFILLNNIIKNKTSRVIYCVILYNLFLTFSTFINNNGMMISSIYKSLLMISFCSVVENSLIEKDYKVISISYFLLLMYTIINLYTILKYPNGMWISPITKYWQNWFLGYDNNHIVILLPLLIFGYAFNILKFNKLKGNYWFTLLLVNVTILKTWSVTSIVGIFLVDIYVFFINNKIKLRQLYNLLKYYVLAFFAIVIFRLQNIFSFLIVNVLKKDLTFSDRTYIWDYVISYIKSKPIFGYGIQESSIRYNISNIYQSYHAHNLILELLYRGGFALLIIFVYMVYITIKKLKNQNDNLSHFFIWSIFVYAVILLTEFYEPINFIYLLVIFYNVTNLRKEVV